MSISVKCRNCGRSYSVKDEFAGKKFRCQECQTPVAVPEASDFEANDWDTGDADDDFGADNYDDYDDYGDDDARSLPPAPKRVPKKKKKPEPSKKTPKKRSSSSSSASEIGPMIGKIGGGLFVGLIAFSLAFKIFSGGMGLGASWESFTTPDGNLTMQMPGKAKPVKVKVMAPGGQSLGVEKRDFACIVVIEPMPPEMNGMTEEEMLNAMQLGTQFLGASNAERTTLNGHPCVSFEQSAPGGIKAYGKAVIHKNVIYTLNYAYKDGASGNMSKFFDSITFN
jgi:hypothetical protein